MSKAADLAQKAYQLNSLEPRNLERYGVILYQQAVIFKTKKRLPEALKLYLDWVEIDPSNPQAYDAVGLVYLELGQPDLALKYFLKEAEVDNNAGLAYAHSGEAYKQLGRFDEAIQSYKKALEIAPGWPVAQEQLELITNLKSSLDK
jgi:tetratricopeptide (TPR) repeat protein